MVVYLTTQNGEEAEWIAKISVFGVQDLKDKSLIQIKIDDDIYSCMAIQNDSVWELWIAQIVKNHNKVHDTFIEKITNPEAFFKLLKRETAWLV